MKQKTNIKDANPSRERWSSRLVFLFASVASAVGLGNILRFPYLVHKYGGGTFLIAYFVMLFILGVPLLCLEFAFGQKMQSGPVQAFSKVLPPLKYMGYAIISCAFLLSCYYCILMAWIIRYIFVSFGLQWGSDPQAFFFQNILHISDSIEHLGGCVPAILLALILAWICVYFSIWKGIKGVGKVVLVTMPLPIVILIILLIKMLFLPGSFNGITHYFSVDFPRLLDTEVWFMATSQVFFTLTIGLGVMITYGSYKDEKTDIFSSALITTIVNSSISFVAGLVIFCILGYSAFIQQKTIGNLSTQGISLAFVTFPQALSLLPYASFIAVSFFIMLFTLAVDSAFSMVESFASFFYDKYPDIPKPLVVFFICLAGLTIGIIFTTRAGLHYIRIVDHFLMTYGVMLAILSQCLIVGWMYGAKKLRLYINEVSNSSLGSWWDFFIKYLIPIILIVLCSLSFYRDIMTAYRGYPRYILLIFGWSIVFFMLSSMTITLVKCILYHKKNSSQ